MKHLTTFRLIDTVAQTKSIRKAAETAAITPSALLRRIQGFEDELGEPIFERLSDGVRLNAAGELVIDHIRKQLAETDKLRSRLGDLSGVRSGHVSIAWSQALTFDFLPKEVNKYATQYPDVTFDIQVLDHSAAEKALLDYSVDLAFIFDPNHIPEFQVTIAVQQQLSVLMSKNHPLAEKETLRLNACMDYPWALPSKIYGGRVMLERALGFSSHQPDVKIQSNSFEFLKNYVRYSDALSFQIPIGLHEETLSGDLRLRQIDTKDLSPNLLFFGQRAGRTLPVASARFADQVIKSLAQLYPLAGS